jgi:hypothetical protein
LHVPRRRSRVTATIAVGAVLTGLAAAAFSGSGSADPRSNQAAARADAASLLGQIRLPAGATTSATTPPGSAFALSRSQSVVVGAVDDHLWWVVPGSRAEVIAYVMGHPPGGSQLLFTGAGSLGSSPSGVKQQFSEVGFSLPSVKGVLGTRQLIVTAVGLAGARSAVRVDAVVQPIRPRPASERVPAGAQRLVVTDGWTGQRVQGPLTYTSARTIARVRQLLNQLPLFPPGAFACPLDTGIRIRLTFEPKSGSKPLAVAVVDPTGCGGITLSVRGKREPALSGDASLGSGAAPKRSLVQRLDSILHVTLATGFPPKRPQPAPAQTIAR